MKPLCLLLLLAACTPVPEFELYLNKPVNTQQKNSERFVRVLVGERKQLAASAERSDGSLDKNTLLWHSEDPGIARVDAQGILTGIKPGKTGLQLRSAQRPELQIRIEVEVEANPESADAEIVDSDAAQ